MIAPTTSSSGDKHICKPIKLSPEEPVAGAIMMNSSSSDHKLEKCEGSCQSKHHHFDELAVWGDVIDPCHSVLCIGSSW